MSGLDPAALLRRLTEASGASGHELEIGALLRDSLAPLVDSLETDALGNLIGRRAGRLGPAGPTVLLAAHQDEIGLVVTAVEAGFLRFTGIGGWDPRVLVGQPVWVHGASRRPGIVGTRPPHVLGPEERAKTLPMDELFVDLGLDADTVAAEVAVGDVVTLRGETRALAGGRWAGKAMDNRASVAALVLALEALGGLAHDWNVLAVATVQEEVGLKGAMTAGYGLAPTLAIALDVGFAKQPGAGDLPYALDGGPLVACGPNIHPKVFEALMASARRLEMGTQLEPLPGPTGTDAGALQVAGAGLPCGLVGIPLRYMHSSVETLALADLLRVARLVADFVATLDAGFVDGLREGAGDWGPATAAGAGEGRGAG